MSNKDKRTPSQKIEDLEKALLGVGEAVNRMYRQVATLQESVKLLGQKSNAMIRTQVRGLAMTPDNVMDMMTELSVEAMQEMVARYVADGIFTPTDVISETSFVVGRDLDRDDNTIVSNPRLQFNVTGDVPPELRPKLIGKKAGDLVEITPGANLLQIMEIYQVGAPSLPREEDSNEGAVASTEEMSNEAVSG